MNLALHGEISCHPRPPLFISAPVVEAPSSIEEHNSALPVPFHYISEASTWLPPVTSTWRTNGFGLSPANGSRGKMAGNGPPDPTQKATLPIGSTNIRADQQVCNTLSVHRPLPVSLPSMDHALVGTIIALIDPIG